MPEPATPSTGQGVLHLICRPGHLPDGAGLRAAVDAHHAAGGQLVPVALLGHKGDVLLMALHEDLWQLRALQTGVQGSGFEVVDSYVSLTEISEYAAGVPDEMKQARLYPQLPPEGKPAYCFYPMSKRRDPDANWFTLPFDERKDLMYEHGASGRTFAGRVLQVVTGSTGIDDFEWGVTLFAQRPDDLKEVVYTMRFDRASALYAEFGLFYTGMVGTLDEVLAAVLGDARDGDE